MDEKKKNWFLRHKIISAVLAVIVIAAVASGLGNTPTSDKAVNEGSDNTTSQPQESEPESTAPAEEAFSTAASFDNGTHEVGKDIQAGTYRTTGKDASNLSCYWERLSGFSGNLDDILANGNASKNQPQIVTILPTDKGFKTEGCGKWYMELKQVTESKTSFGEGTFAVNVDLEPGTYKNSGAADQYGCYWARLSGFSGELDETIANDNTQNTIVTIAATDAGFTSHGCGTWTKQ